MNIEKTTENLWAQSAITPSRIDALIRKARAERAEAMRVSLSELPANFKRWIANFRPIRERAPHKGAWA